MNKMRFGAAYGAPPTFSSDVDSMGYLDIASLGLSASLLSDVAEWNEEFQETFCADYPPDSKLPSEVIAHNLRGASLVERIKAELGPHVSVEFIPLKP